MESSLTDAGDTRSRILDAAEALLRRHGLEKLTVLDVARALDMSHGNVYRHFTSKADLRATVIERWLDRIATQTEVVAQGRGPATDRLREWLHLLAEIKRRKVVEDTELLVAATKIVRDSPAVEHSHSSRLTAQMVRILRDGLADGTLPGVSSPEVSARAVLNATVRFHHPDLVATGGPAAAQSAALSEVISLLMTGLVCREGCTDVTQLLGGKLGPALLDDTGRRGIEPSRPGNEVIDAPARSSDQGGVTRRSMG